MEKKKFLSPVCRASWVFLFGDGDLMEESVSKYKLTLMIPKNAKACASLRVDPARVKTMVEAGAKFKAEIEAHCTALAQDNFEDGWKKVRWNPLIDGDEESHKFEGNANFWLLRAKSKFKPEVSKARAADGNIVEGDASDTGIYSGAWCRAFITPFPYDIKGKKGVSLGLGGVQKAYNDERFGGSKDKFADDIEELPPEDGEFENLE